MAYENPTSGGGMDPGMAQAQESGPQSAAPEGDEHQDGEQQDEGKGYTCFLPGDFPGAENLKAGDMLSLKVVGKDKDGDIEVQHIDEGEGEGNQKMRAGKSGMMDHFDEEVR